MPGAESDLEQFAYDLARDHSELLRNLVAIRRAHASQEEVGQRMGGISQPAVSLLERYDSNPTLATLRRYAHAVGANLVTQVECRCGADHTLEAPSVPNTERLS